MLPPLLNASINNVNMTLSDFFGVKLTYIDRNNLIQVTGNIHYACAQDNAYDNAQYTGTKDMMVCLINAVSLFPFA